MKIVEDCQGVNLDKEFLSYESPDGTKKHYTTLAFGLTYCYDMTLFL